MPCLVEQGGEMKQEERSQYNRAELVDEFWSLQNHPQAEAHAESLDPSEEVEAAAISDALSRDPQKMNSAEYGRFLATYYSLLQNSRMTFLEFVRTRFIPQHVMSKAPAGQRHFHAMLKHILRPDIVDALFGTNSHVAYRKLACAQDWPYLDDLRLCDLHADHVRSVLSSALDKGYSVQTVKHIRNVIGSVLTLAIRRRCFSGDNPAFQVPLPRLVHRQAGELSAAQVRQLIGLMKPPDRDIALCAVFTGLNMVELCGLQWKHVNLANSPRLVGGSSIPGRSIAVRKQANGNKLMDVRSHRVRDVRVNGGLLCLLRSRSRRSMYSGPEDFVFGSRTGTALWPANLQLRLKPLGHDLGLAHVSWHQFTRAHKTVLPEFAAIFARESSTKRGKLERIGGEHTGN
jgi:site-specific recombinase XerC